MSRSSLRKTVWRQMWYVDTGGDVILDPETGKLYGGKMVLEIDDLVEMLDRMGYAVTKGNVIGGSI